MRPSSLAASQPLADPSDVARRPKFTWAACLVGLAVFASSLFLYTRHNTFPWRYHTDELSKVNQILSGERNYNHPPLMLELADRVLRACRIPRETNSVLMTGRWVSAGMVALGVTALALAAHARAGLGAMVLVASAVGLCPPALAAGHYFKEDGPLVGGVALVAAAGWMYAIASERSRRAAPWAFLLGAAVAVAASSKYVGVLAFVPALALVVFTSGGKNRALIPLVFVVGFAFTCAAVNFRAFAEFSRFRDGFEREREHSTILPSGLKMNRPNGFFVAATFDETLPHVALIACLALGMLPVRARKGDLRAWDLVIPVLFPALFLAALSWSIIPQNRYVIPVVFLLHLLAACGVIWTAEWVSERTQRSTAGIWVTAIGMIVLSVPLLMRCLIFDHQFGHDTRDAARAWITRNLPPHALIAAESRAGLVGIDDQRPVPADERIDFVVINTRQLAELGDFDTLRAGKVQYVVTCSTASDRFFSPYVSSPETDSTLVERYRAFYARLRAGSKLVWEGKPSVPMNTAQASPEIKIFELHAP